MNNRQKGKVGERWFKNQLVSIFPEIKRNAAEQSREGGADLVNTENYAFECKYGRKYNSKMIRGLITQAEKQAKDERVPVVLIKPHKEKAYAVIPFEYFLSLIAK